MGSQSVILDHEILDVQKILVGWIKFFFLALKFGRKNHPVGVLLEIPSERLGNRRDDSEMIIDQHKWSYPGGSFEISSQATVMGKIGWDLGHCFVGNSNLPIIFDNSEVSWKKMCFFDL